MCFSLAYFLWDSWESITTWEVSGHAFVIHGVVCSAVYMVSMVDQSHSFPNSFRSQCIIIMLWHFCILNAQLLLSIFIGLSSIWNGLDGQDSYGGTMYLVVLHLLEQGNTLPKPQI
jgi:hypothetical protein